MDRRSVFFLVAAVVCALLVPLTQPALQRVPEVVSVLYVILALASYLDARSDS